MLLGRTGLTLSGVGLQSGGELATGVRGIDHVGNLSTGGSLAVIAPRLKTLVSIRGAAEDPAGGSDGAARNITLRGLSFAHSAPSCEPPQARPHPSRSQTAGEMC